MELQSVLQYIRSCSNGDLAKISKECARVKKIADPLFKPVSIVTLMKEIVLCANPVYSWVGVDGKSAKLLQDRIRTIGKARTGEEPSDDDVLKFFKAMLNTKYHPEYFKGNWDMKKLNSEFNSITANMQKPVSQGKILDSAIAIRQASQNLLDKGLIRTYDQYLKDEENFSI